MIDDGLETRIMASLAPEQMIPNGAGISIYSWNTILRSWVPIVTDMETAYATIESSIRECDSHLAKIERDERLLNPIFPLDEESFSGLDDDMIEHIDQLVYRFTKLQDSMGTRLLPSMYTLLENTNDPKPFLLIGED